MAAFLKRFLSSNRPASDIALQAVLLATVIALTIAAILQISSSLDRNGLSFSFDFLGQSAGNTIDPSVIDYESGDTSARGLFAGALNSLWLTLLVILVSTLFAAALTLARLSNHWALSTLVGCFCNVIRNTPLLLQLPFFLALGFSLFSYARYSPRGLEPNFGIYVTSKGFYLPWIDNLFPLAAVFIVSLAITLLLHRKLKQRQIAWADGFPAWIAWLLPSIVVAVFAWTSGLLPQWQVPRLDKYDIVGGILLSQELIVAVIAFAAYGGTQLSDILYQHVRALAAEASTESPADGLRQTIGSLAQILPKLVHAATLPCLNSYHTMFKNTALASAVFYTGLDSVVGTVSNQTGHFLENLFILLAFYLVVSCVMKAFIHWVQSRPSFRDRPPVMHLLPATDKSMKNSAANNGLNRFRTRLFYDRLSTAASILVFGLIIYLCGSIWDWSLNWGETMARRFECSTAANSCWSHISAQLELPDRFIQFLIGFFPPEETWRAYVSIAMFFGILIVAAFAKLSHHKLLVLILLTVFAMWFLSPGIFPGSSLSEIQGLGGLWLTLLLASLAIVVGFLLGNILAFGSLSRLPLVRFLCRLVVTGTSLLPPVILIRSGTWILLVFLFPSEALPREYKFFASSLMLVMVAAIEFAAVIRESLMLAPSFSSRTEKLAAALNNCIPALTATAVYQVHYTTFYQNIVASYDFSRIAIMISSDLEWTGLYSHLALVVIIVYLLISNLIRFAGRRIEARRKAQLTS